MKKKLFALVVAVAMVVSAIFALVACTPKVDLGHGDKTITIWVSEMEGVKDLTQKQISAWMDKNADLREVYTIDVQGLTESEAATKMVTDVTTGADVYCFAQDQLARLVEANALVTLNDTQVKYVTDNNDAASAKAAIVNGKTYAYPITSDNGYFMYYDKSVIKTESLDDLAKIVKDCEDANRNFSFELGGSAWYTASFFFGVGCHSSWSYDDEANKWTAADDFNSDLGVIAMKGMQILTKSEKWVDSSKAADFGAAIPSAVVISGTWDSGTAKENLLENYAVAKLPHFTVDGKSYQLGSFSGFKLMGVKPNTDADKLAVCHEIAQLLSAKEAQEDRFDLVGWGPSNKVVQGLDKVKNDAALTALAAQNLYGTPQGNINGGWWDFAKLLGTGSKDAESDDDIKALLADYQKSIEKYETMPVEAVTAWGVIGSIASLAGTTENLAWDQENFKWTDDNNEEHTGWKDWTTDLAMAKEEGKDVYKTVVAIDLKTTDEFKIRQGQGWDNNYGADGALVAGTPVDGVSGGSNLTVAEDGKYYIVLTIDGDTAKIELVAAE